MSYFEKASRKYSEDVVDFVASLAYCGAYSYIDLADAKCDIEEWVKEEIDFPEDLTPEAYVELWNALVDDDEEDILCMKH